MGDNLDKMAKTFIKITKLAFLGQNSGGVGGGQVTFSGNGGDPPSPPLGETLKSADNIIGFR